MPSRRSEHRSKRQALPPWADDAIVDAPGGIASSFDPMTLVPPAPKSDPRPKRRSPAADPSRGSARELARGGAGSARAIVRNAMPVTRNAAATAALPSPDDPMV